MSAITLETIKEDLKYQLTFETDSFDWDYFLEIAQEAKKIAEKEKEKLETQPTLF